MLKPLFNAAKKSTEMKHKTFLTKDKLIIDGKSYSAATFPNLMEANKVLDLQGTCQRTDDEKIIFLGCHSVFSNLHTAHFHLDNINYNCVEQRIQSAKTSMFDDDITHHKIMRELNPYKIKKLGSRVHNYNDQRWRAACKQIAYAAIHAKFTQNDLLRNILVNTGQLKIAESSTDPLWGTGLHLYDRKAMDERYWADNGGLMCDIYSKLREEIRKN